MPRLNFRGCFTMIRFILTGLLLAISVSAQAHHSMTHFEEAVTEMEGVLVDISWRNPHVFFFLETEEANGEKKTWEMEAGTIYVLGRAGVTRDLFTLGETVRVAGNRSGVYDDKFWVENILTENGNEVLVVLNGAPRWNDELIGGRSSWNNEAFIRDEVAAQGNGFFRVWSPPVRGSVTPRLTGAPTNQLANIATDASKAAIDGWDPYAFDDACELPGLPRVNHGPHPHGFVQEGENILLVSEEFYITRTIHMNSDVDPETQPLSPLGYSVGRWEDENTLIVETSRINFPYLNLGGYGQSEQVHITERYVLDDEENRMDYEVIIRDPVMLNEPYIKRDVWVDIGESINEEYDCVPKTASH